MRKTIAGIFLFLFAISVSAQSSQTDLPLKDIHGHSFKLSDFKGKVVLLNFWATWCPPCRKEIPQLIKLQHKYRKAGLQIIGITYPPEKLSSVRAFAKKSQANYPLVLGSERTKSNFTSSEVLPVTVVIDRVGNVREVIEGILLPEEIDEKIKPLLSESIPLGPRRPCLPASKNTIEFKRDRAFPDRVRAGRGQAGTPAGPAPRSLLIFTASTVRWHRTAFRIKTAVARMLD